MDLNIVVWLDHYAIDEEPDQPLPRGEVCAVEARTNLSNEIRELRTDRTAKLGIVESSICLLERINQNGLTTLDLLPPAEQVVHLKPASLVGVDEPLELSVVSLDFAVQSIDLALKRLGSPVTVESRVSRNPFRVGHHGAQVIPHDLVEDLGLHGCHRALRLWIPVTLGLRVLDAVVIAEHESFLAPRLSPRTDDRVAASPATQQAPEQQVVVVVRAPQSKALVVCEALLHGIEEIAVKQRGS